MPVTSVRWRAVASPLAAVLWTGTIWVASPHGGIPRTYPASSSSLAVLDLLCGGGVVAAGVFWWWQGRAGSIGPLLLALGATWLAVDWSGWEPGPAWVRTLGTLVAPFALALIAHLAHTARHSRVRRGRTWHIVLAGYLATGIFVGFWALCRDPLRDRYCWNNCTANVLLVQAHPQLNRTVTTVWWWLSAAAGVAIGVQCVVGLVRSSSSGRRRMIGLMAPLAVVAVTYSVRAAVLLVVPVEDASRPLFVAVFVVQAGGLGLLAAGAIASLGVERWRIRALSRLVEDLEDVPAPGSLRAVLASSLGDDSLDIVYWLPDLGRYVDGSGAPIELGRDDRVSVPIVRGGRTIAVVLHDPTSALSRDLETEIGAAARLAVDNERLRAEALAQVADLRASQARIVEASDRERRALERNLHDGAQQRLLALSYELRLAESRIRASGADGCADRVADAAQLAAAALAALRELAHGIHPVILEEAGIGAALSTVIDTAPIVVRLSGVPDERFEFEVEIAVYLLVCAGIVDAALGHAGALTVTIVRSASSIDVELVDDRTHAVFDEVVHVADRVGALGGLVQMSATRTRAVIPCG